VIIWLSVLLSAFIDNIPYTVAMIPVAKLIAVSLGMEPELFLFGLLIGTSLGGNITPIGASANVVAVGMLKKQGYPVTFGEFARIGLPFTLAAVGTAYVFLWVVWGR
jgi:Na+/H+ antiporter NhaD/arsenite permease-like protein